MGRTDLDGNVTAFVYGAKVCNRRYVCPTCAYRLTGESAQTVSDVLRGWESLGPDHQAGFLTLTIGHRSTDTLTELLRVADTAFRMMTNSRTWKSYRKAGVLAHYVKALEVTHSQTDGWHPHYHVLTLTRDYLTLHVQASEWIKQEWHRCVAAASETGPRRINAMQSHQDFRQAEMRDAGRIANYVTKDGRRWSVASEMARWMDKEGREQSFAPQELLALAAEGDHVAGRLWQVWAAAMSDKKSLIFSHGLRDELQTAIERLPHESWSETYLDDGPKADFRLLVEFRDPEGVPMGGALPAEQLAQDKTFLRDLRDLAERYSDHAERAKALEEMVLERGLPAFVPGSGMREPGRSREVVRTRQFVEDDEEFTYAFQWHMETVGLQNALDEVNRNRRSEGLEELSLFGAKREWLIREHRARRRMVLDGSEGEMPTFAELLQEM